MVYQIVFVQNPTEKLTNLQMAKRLTPELNYIKNRTAAIMAISMLKSKNLHDLAKKLKTVNDIKLAISNYPKYINNTNNFRYKLKDEYNNAYSYVTR